MSSNLIYARLNTNSLWNHQSGLEVRKPKSQLRNEKSSVTPSNETVNWETYQERYGNCDLIQDRNQQHFPQSIKGFIKTQAANAWTLTKVLLGTLKFQGVLLHQSQPMISQGSLGCWFPLLFTCVQWKSKSQPTLDRFTPIHLEWGQATVKPAIKRTKKWNFIFLFLKRWNKSVIAKSGTRPTSETRNSWRRGVKLLGG